jgi:lipid A 4'-phosphatase
MNTRPSLLWIAPLLLFLLFLPFSSDIDLDVASFFLSSHSRFKAPNWCLFVYNYGLLPGQLLFLGGFAAFIASFWKNSIFYLRWPALYICLTLLVGSGLFGHAFFKQFWERPRPKQVNIYGGKYPFCPLLSPYQGPSDRFLRSLPSGHATMGFYFFSLYFLGKRLSSRRLSWTGAAAAVFLGGAISWARLAQGGHFVSDIVASLIIMWMSAYWLDRFLACKIDHGRRWIDQMNAGRKRGTRPESTYERDSSNTPC